mmetsp:Transcript_36771/g.49724  ORF Transcript_36771/g.49724 Transcript_36771/m.49724 type:complete len:118 (-) Transcript_36771:57-410(-)
MCKCYNCFTIFSKHPRGRLIGQVLIKSNDIDVIIPRVSCSKRDCFISERFRWGIDDEKIAVSLDISEIIYSVLESAFIFMGGTKAGPPPVPPTSIFVEKTKHYRDTDIFNLILVQLN